MGREIRHSYSFVKNTLELKKHKIILTGATGFIGRYVLEELSNNPFYEVYCITNKETVSEKHKNIHQYHVDLLDFTKAGDDKLRLLLEEIKPDSCLHLAWYTGHKDYLISPLNLQWQEASIRLINYFYESGGKRLLSTGTCIEYSLKESGRHKENTTPIQPISLYAQSKVNVLNYLKERNKEQKMNYLWSRIYFIYGPGEQKSRLVPYIIHSLQNDKQAKPNNGLAIRDYIYVKDLSRQLISLLESDAQGVVNTGSGKPVQVQTIFDQIGKIVNKESLIIKDEQELGLDVPAMIAPDLTLFHTYVKDFVYTPLDEGLKLTIESYRK
jgi:nucleoside-diphosphate-sugar epimerase